MVDDEELVFEAVRARVVAGEHLDHMPGLPGMDLEGGGYFEYAPDGRLQRIHERGEAGFRAARDSGRIPPLPPLTPATPEALRVVEDAASVVLPAGAIWSWATEGSARATAYCRRRRGQDPSPGR
ncbi:hypothetical protein KZZ52_26990 [Dactylosporangium sp. AC04546]|uniref:hypothetical protein n=1 Tax=Dactylosporangium sp. AC04546 TaxID=2862460 RepID=UPI001EDDB019|nr:hypothetical protein [Dactylosporangium sp. AC04546]WVK88913.1 hypothetical protein KZZ52_26990 [Dactylosporangium sp. AC04546]